MPALNPTRQNALLLVALLFAQLLLMAGSARGAEGATFLELSLMRVTRPFVNLAGAVGGGVRRGTASLRELIAARRENRLLQHEVHRLDRELKLEQEATLENLRLRRLLGMRDELAPQAVGASLVTANLSEQSKMIVVDRGTDHGVHVDLPVVAWGGAVGRVVSAGAKLAKVRLLTDPSSGVSGLIQRTRVGGMVLGQGEDRVLRMLYVPRFSDVMLGDRIVTSGLDGVFPRGFGIGTVIYVGEDPGVSKVILLRPEVDFTRLEEVLVLLEQEAGPLLDRDAEHAERER